MLKKNIWINIIFSVHIYYSGFYPLKAVIKSVVYLKYMHLGIEELELI